MNCSRYISELAALQQDGMLRSIPLLEGHGKWAIVDGKRVLNLSSNDYLALLDRDDLITQFLDGFKEGIPRFSAASSRLLTGNSSSAIELESLLAERFGKESALLFNSGYHANVGIVSALASKESYIIADKRVHASIIDGIKLSGAKFSRFNHNDIEHLESIIKRVQGDYSQIFIITEAIFSMGGDRGRVSEIVALKSRYDNLVIYVDEAHSFGLFGANGLGVCEQESLLDSVDIIVGTFGKAISSVGAFAILPSAIREYLVNRSRPLIFSTALPPINIEWSRFIVERLDSLKTQRDELAATATLFRDELSKIGYQTDSQSQILTLRAGSADRAVALYKELKDRGFYALPVRPPTLPACDSGVRFSLTASIKREEILELCNTIKELTI